MRPAAPRKDKGEEEIVGEEREFREREREKVYGRENSFSLSKMVVVGPY